MKHTRIAVFCLICARFKEFKEDADCLSRAVTVNSNARPKKFRIQNLLEKFLRQCFGIAKGNHDSIFLIRIQLLGRY